jgi:membrane protein
MTDSTWARTRSRIGWLDHLVRAGVRYDRADGGRLAAAVTYYAFFAAFAVALLGLAVLGYVLDDPKTLHAVQDYLTANLPRMDAQALREVRGTVGVIAFVTLPVTGLFWVDSLRSSIRAIWRLEEYPGSLLVRAVVDLLVLAGLAVLLVISLVAAFGTNVLASTVVVAAAGADPGAAHWPLTLIGVALAVGVNTLFSLAVLSALPRLRMPFRRMIGPALLIAIGLELLKTVGRIYVERTEANLLNQLILFSASLTATSTVGQVVDLAAGPAPQPIHLRRRLAGRRRGRIQRAWSVRRAA